MNSFKGKKVLVFGLGLNQGGVGSAKFFASNGARVRVTDLKSKSILQSSIDKLKDFPDLEYTLGEHKYEDIDWADLIIKNPSVKPGNEYIGYARKSGKEIETDMGIFLKFVKPSQIIGITGTKGKSTTASLIYEILKTNDREAVFAGNIGKSVLDTISFVKQDTVVVLEISSFQLEAFDKTRVSPKWAVITNITPDHLNYYQIMDEYIAAKKIIGKYQGKSDFLFIRNDDPVVDKPDFLNGLNGKIIRFQVNDLSKNFKPKLKGQHNLENAAATLAIGKFFGVNEKSILNSIATFKGIPFRMELLKIWKGIKIINDTTATAPDAGIKALETASHMSSGNVILICGGMNKNIPYENYIKAVNKYAKKVFFLEGDVTDLIRSCKPGLHIKTFGPYSNLEKLLRELKDVVKSGDVVLFSPAATSFNLFQNEFDRGRKFNAAARKIFK
ncbi:MAG: UDP-N-acetylmuramoyl-L-alanine--D-glutamate ligase [Patescibacteria group bacterium]